MSNMPITGNQSQEHPTSEESPLTQNVPDDPTTYVGTVGSSENSDQLVTNVLGTVETSGEVSSTTMDNFVQDDGSIDQDICPEPDSNTAVPYDQNVDTPSNEPQKLLESSNVTPSVEENVEFTAHAEPVSTDISNLEQESVLHSEKDTYAEEHELVSHTTMVGDEKIQEGVIESSLNVGVDQFSSISGNVTSNIEQPNVYYQDTGNDLSQVDMAEVTSDALETNALEVVDSSTHSAVVSTEQLMSEQSESLTTEMPESNDNAQHLTAEAVPSEQSVESEDIAAVNDDVGCVEELHNTPHSGMAVDDALSNVASDAESENIPITSDSNTDMAGGKELSDVNINIEQTITQSSSEDINDDKSAMDISHVNDTDLSAAAPEDNEDDPAIVSGTALTSVDDEFGPSKDTVTTPPPQARSASQPVSSANSFQSAFAAFASAASLTEEKTFSSMEVDESAQDTQLTATSSAMDAPSVHISSTMEAPSVHTSSTMEAQSVNTPSEMEPPKTSESKKISVLQMPGSIAFRGSQLDSEQGSSETLTDVDQTQAEEGTVPVQEEDVNPVMQTEAAPAELTSDGTVTSDAVYFIQMTDASGEVVPSIIDPNDIASYSDSIVYRQCMGADGQIETTIVSSGGVPFQEEQAQQQQIETAEPQSEMEQQVIYAHDLNGQLTPIDSAQSANDVAPPGKQFVYMQDSSGRIIRTIMDANQTMVPGQQVYYTQSEDGRIITSVMDSESTEEASQQQYQQVQETQANQLVQQQAVQQQQEESVEDVSGPAVASQSQPSSASGFSMDNSMSGLSMLAELSQSHLTAGQASVEMKGSSNADSSSQDGDIDEFRPVAMITRRVTEDGLETVNTDMASLKVAQRMHDVSSESMLAKLTAEIKAASTVPLVSVSRDNLFVQWQNLDAMCWMDVILIMLVYSPSLRPLVHLDPSHELASTLLITLLKANRQAQVLLQNLLKKNSDSNSFQKGAGNTASSSQDAKTSKLVCKENMDEIGKAINLLYAMREQIWRALQPRLRCERGKHNSPVLVLPLLIREKPLIKQMFTMNFRYVFKCDKCGYSQDDSHSKILPTIPAVPANFNMKDPCFVRNCFECKAPNQRMFMKFEGLQDFVQMHFVKGLPHNRFDELSFDHNNDHYEVTAVVHYKNNPDHFIAWVRNAPGNTWMECDDLKSVITRYQNGKPCIPPSQVHMVMWERRLTPAHTLVMRDTDDTKLLASLVLTVQQPAGSQTTTPDTSAAKTSGTLASSLSAQGMTPQGTASSFLSGLISQSQSTNFSPYTPRGRGNRGGRGGRGSRGGRNSTVTIRRGLTPASTQMISPALTTATIRQPGSPQIIRLPLSALQGMGAQLRGSVGTGTPQRLILMGGNSGTQTAQSSASGAPKKVVVVRSQDGAGGLNQLSATQLLQLLQRTGAISNANTRITTTISRPSTDGTTQQQTITLTPETPTSQLSVPATTDSTESVAQAVQSVPVAGNEAVEGLTTGEPTTEAPMEVDQTLEESQTLETTTAVTEEASSQAVSIDPTLSSEIVQEAVSEASVAQVTTTAISTVPETNAQSKISTVNINSGAIRTLNRAGLCDSNRYVQIPNPKGGPNIMTQLVMRGDKMMLVPVEKSQPQAASTASSPVVRISAASSFISGSLQSGTAANSTQILSSSTASAATTTVSAASAGQTTRYITIPGQGQGGKRTIQLISVPRGSTSSAASAGPSKTFIVGASGSQSGARLISQSPGEVVSSQQQGNIIVREIKRPEDDTAASVISTTLTAGGDSGTHQIPLAGSSAVSLLRDITIKPQGTSLEEGRAQGISILSQSAVQAASKAQETFKYILPGSNTQQISSIHTMSGAHMGNKAFTALSSSGTIIGGQLTPVSTNTPDMVPSPVESVDAGVQSIFPELDAISPSVVSTPIRGRGRGSRGVRGKGRGSIKTPGRGRGVRQQISHSTFGQVPTKVVGRGGTISMLPAGFHGVGGQIIETSAESVDGAPVVSIPDFSPVVTTVPNEPLVTTESGLMAAAASTEDSIYQTVQTVTSTSSSSPLQTTLALTTQESSTEGPRVITQPIPSIKANHGFDILTQGILGTANNQSSPRKTGISLLTGKPVTSPPTASLSTSFTSGVSRMQQTLAMGHSVTQSEIETLIKAAQGAAKPPKPGESVVVPEQSLSVPSVQETQDIVSEGAVAQVQAFNVDDFLCAGKNDDKTQAVSDKADDKMDPEDSGGDELQAGGAEDVEQGDYSDMDTSVAEPQETNDNIECAEQHEKRVFSIDESQVSAAERYRMPTELFQPDEESPEKPVRGDGLSHQFSGTNILGDDLPAKLFHDSEVCPQDDEVIKSTNQGPTSPSHKHGRVDPLIEMMKIQDSVDKESIEEKGESDSADVVMEDQTISADSCQKMVTGEPEVVAESTVLSSSKKGRKKSKGKGSKHQNKSTGRQKSNNSFSSDVESTPAVGSPPQPIICSPQRESNLTVVEEQIISPSGDKTNNTLHELEEIENVPEIKNEEAVADVGDVKKSENVLENGEQIDEVKDIISLAQDSDIKKGDFVEKKMDKENITPHLFKSTHLKSSILTLPTAVCKKKQKSDWGNEEVEKQPVVFSYKFLTRTRRKPSKRHSSLGPRTLLFTTPSSPFVTLRDKEEICEPLSCVVKRRQPKALERPAVDPSKEPTVIPLVPEEDADPACTCGGSVVTSHSDGEVFTGVVVRQRPEVADWNNGIFEEEADVLSEKWEDKESLKEYIETMWTSMCMEIGFSDFFGDDISTVGGDDDESDDGGSCDVSEEESAIVGSSVTEDKSYSETEDKSYSETEVDIDIEKAFNTISNEKRKMVDESPALLKDSKRMKYSSDEESSVVINDPVPLSDTISDTNTIEVLMSEKPTIQKSQPSDVAEAPTITSPTPKIATLATAISEVPALGTTMSSPTRVNGISNTVSSKEHVVSTLPFIHSTTPGPTSSSSTSSTTTTSSSSTSSTTSSSTTSLSKKRNTSSPAFISPARRSSRTPVPSIKLRDSLDEGGVAMKILSKGRRSSLVSSDEDVSGYSSDEVAIKKKVKKHLQS